MHKFFRYPKLFWNIEGMPTKFFGTVRQKIFDGNMWYPLLCIKFFRYPKLFETLKGCPQNLSALWDKKNFDGNLWYPLLCIKFFDTSNFLKHWRDAHEIFRHCETKIFRRKHVIPPIKHKIFPIPQTFWNIEGMPTKFFGTVREKSFDGNMWYPLLCIKFFRYPKLSETLKGCPQNLSALWDKKFSTKNWNNLYYA